ncbi:MAG: SH3 domain-containing protein [Zetaproteobacteria bacterium]|nr:MAG: SH3 domain-containing protein [Zetaproteobacteria bacterium]
MLAIVLPIRHEWFLDRTVFLVFRILIYTGNCPSVRPQNQVWIPIIGGISRAAMNWTLQMFKQIAAGISGFFGLIGDIADFLAPFAPYLMALSGVSIIVMLCMKFFTEWGQNLYAAIIFACSVFLAGLGLQFMDGKQAEQELAKYLPEVDGPLATVLTKVQGLADELQEEYDKIDQKMNQGGALSQRKILIVNVAEGNVRKEPSTSASVSFSLPRGTKVTMLDAQGSWYKIITDDGRTGWAHRVIFGKNVPQP